LEHLPADTNAHHAGGRQGVSRPGRQPARPRAIFWPNFGWLAEESRKWTLQRASAGAGPSSPD
jgi:hypothetical protein